MAENDCTVRDFYHMLIMIGCNANNRILIKYPDPTDRDGYDLVMIDSVERDGNDIIIKVGGVDDGRE